MKALTISKDGTTYQVDHEAGDIILIDVSTPESYDVRVIKDGYYDLQQEAIDELGEDYDGDIVRQYAIDNLTEAAERLFEKAIRVEEDRDHHSIAA